MYFTAVQGASFINERRDPSISDIMKWPNDEKKTIAGDKQKNQWDSGDSQ